jgi:hypothetical protein
LRGQSNLSQEEAFELRPEDERELARRSREELSLDPASAKALRQERERWTVAWLESQKGTGEQEGPDLVGSCKTGSSFGFYYPYIPHMWCTFYGIHENAEMQMIAGHNYC